MTLEEYFRDSLSKGNIDHEIRASLDETTGTIRFYLHPSRASGNTLDFWVTGNALSPAGWAH